ncbi:hypothetical protein EDC04DRAFT_2783318 [Pisolithus marmoratus]|nr:hypothetical protein EDC04DRAFT_2783318 [Pisolithus marmoratus]
MQIRRPPLGVTHPPKLGDLTCGLWTTRAWTLQELLAPKVFFFYDSKWKPYLSDAGRNHMEFPVIMQELADAFDIRYSGAREASSRFDPQRDGRRGHRIHSHWHIQHPFPFTANPLTTRYHSKGKT